ncbi:MBL fold metallo-hydrolase [Hymenobacter coccineus]|uniref:MBL fold metallo-hydrolase n=1 Tax=Hymenobacter coccineus TaxID=1908235 RepID=A0A1G1TJF4_9BACT|nr:MBL fold metallo-hydrolase [Hymenobacter coccineus]OGX90987.1 MBL fold metallo-hydrolase [Hymenobacter coccineus]
MKQITNRLHQISLGAVNAFVLKDDGLTLIDTGLPGSTDKIFKALQKEGKNPSDIKRIILTHLHTDHAGNAADIKRRVNARVYAHQLDAQLLEKGISSRPMTLTPGLTNRFIYQLFIKSAGDSVQPVAVEEQLTDNDVIPLAGGIRVIHTPGHSAGHVALLLQSEGVLIAGDICAHVVGLAYSTLYEDITVGKQSILKAAGFSFDKAVFGHGHLLHDEAANRKMAAKFS